MPRAWKENKYSKGSNGWVGEIGGVIFLAAQVYQVPKILSQLLPTHDWAESQYHRHSLQPENLLFQPYTFN